METATTDNATAIALRTTKNINRCLEKIAGVCDGTHRVYPQYRTGLSPTYITLSDVTKQSPTTGQWDDIEGSSISYIPPALGTRGTVIYKFSCCLSRTSDTEGMASFRVNLAGTGIDQTIQVIGSGGFYGHQVIIEAIIEVDSGLSDSLATGVLSSWTAAKTIKAQIWEYSSSTDIVLHRPFYYKDIHGASNSSIPILRPLLSIEAYGNG